MKKEINNLVRYLKRIPAVNGPMGSDFYEDGNWWLKFTIDLDHPQAWNTVQELGHVLNYLSTEEPLPSSFKPVSPPPYLNGNAKMFLSWLIESSDPLLTPDKCLEWLEGRLPDPVSDLNEWPEP